MKISVKEARHLEGYKLEVIFNDNKRKIVAFCKRIVIHSIINIKKKIISGSLKLKTEILYGAGIGI